MLACSRWALNAIRPHQSCMNCPEPYSRALRSRPARSHQGRTEPYFSHLDGLHFRDLSFDGYAAFSFFICAASLPRDITNSHLSSEYTSSYDVLTRVHHGKFVSCNLGGLSKFVFVDHEHSFQPSPLQTDESLFCIQTQWERGWSSKKEDLSLFA